MVDPVTDRNLWNVKRIDALQAADIVCVLLGVGAPLMMSVNATDGAKIVLGRVSVELVNPDVFGAFDDVKPTSRHKRHDCAATPTVRAVATPRIDDTIGQV
jgi:hypothetical protein